MIPVTIDRTWFYFFDQLFNCYKFLTVCCLYVNLVPVYNFFWTAAVQRLIWVLLFPSPEPCVSVFGKKMKKKVRFSQVQRPNLIAFLSQVRPPPPKKKIRRTPLRLAVAGLTVCRLCCCRGWWAALPSSQTQTAPTSQIQTSGMAFFHLF